MAHPEPRAYRDALALVTTPGAAAMASESHRALAWAILRSARQNRRAPKPCPAPHHAPFPGDAA